MDNREYEILTRFLQCSGTTRFSVNEIPTEAVSVLGSTFSYPVSARSVDLTIGLDALIKIAIRDTQYEIEEQMRNNYPLLRELYEQYQIMLTLVKE
jgi:ABC-type transporter lipoprotein component MlaA